MKLDYEVFKPNDDDEGNSNRRPKNDIRDIRSYKQLEKVDLDLESPRLKQAMQNLGIDSDEMRKK